MFFYEAALALKPLNRHSCAETHLADLTDLVKPQLQHDRECLGQDVAEREGDGGLVKTCDLTECVLREYVLKSKLACLANFY